MRHPLSGPRRSAGFTLIELLVVLVVLAILVGLVTPSFDGVTFRTRSRAALDRIAADLYYARILAVRQGTRTVVRFTPRTDGSGCHAPTYSIVVKGAEERTVKTTELELGSDATCLRVDQSDSIVYSSRGLPATLNNRKVYVRRGADADSMTLSLMGRVWRWY